MRHQRGPPLGAVPSEAFVLAAGRLRLLRGVCCAVHPSLQDVLEEMGAEYAKEPPPQPLAERCFRPSLFSFAGRAGRDGG